MAILNFSGESKFDVFYARLARSRVPADLGVPSSSFYYGGLASISDLCQGWNLKQQSEFDKICSSPILNSTKHLKPGLPLGFGGPTLRHTGPWPAQIFNKKPVY
jgi:hypothetical protein